MEPRQQRQNRSKTNRKKPPVKYMTREELLAEAQRLMKEDNAEVRSFGQALHTGLITNFMRVNDFFQAVNKVLYVGGPVLTMCIAAILSTIMMLFALLPFATVAIFLHGQKKFLQSILKKHDPNRAAYLQFIEDVDKGRIQITPDKSIVEGLTESVSILLEAPGDDDDEEPEEEPEEEEEEDGPTDYTAQVNEEEPEAPEGASDYTDDAQDELNTQADAAATAENEPEEDDADTAENDAAATANTDPEDTGEEPPADEPAPTADEGTEDATTGEDTEAEPDAEAPTDYTSEVEPPEEGGEGGEGEEDAEGEAGEEETPEEDPAADDTTGDTADDATDDENEAETGEDEEETKNSNIKNYNLMIDFRKLFTTTSDILTGLGDVIYKHPIQNQILDKGIENIQKIHDQVLNYIELNYSAKYEDNLYHYNIFVQALKLNLEMLKKNTQLDEGNENS